MTVRFRVGLRASPLSLCHGLCQQAGTSSFLTSSTLVPCGRPRLKRLVHRVGMVSTATPTTGSTSMTQQAVDSIFWNGCGQRASNTPATELRIPTHFQEALQREVSIPQMISESQPPYKTVHVNGAWCLSCGYKPEELLGRPVSILFGPQTSPEMRTILEQAFKSGRQVFLASFTHTLTAHLHEQLDSLATRI